jgi:hypothetical protein
MAAFSALACLFAMLAFFKLLQLETELHDQRDKLYKILGRLEDLAHHQDVFTAESPKSKLSPANAEFYRKNFGKEPPR